MFDPWELAVQGQSYPPDVTVSTGLGMVRINNHGDILVPLCETESTGPRHTLACWAVVLTAGQ